MPRQGGEVRLGGCSPLPLGVSLIYVHLVDSYCRSEVSYDRLGGGYSCEVSLGG